jgi:hypothetical protein
MRQGIKDQFTNKFFLQGKEVLSTPSDFGRVEICHGISIQRGKLTNSFQNQKIPIVHT